MTWILVVMALLAGLLVGWDLAVHNYRRTLRILETNINLLEDQIATFQADQLIDPQRAWIDFGKRNVINQMETTMRTIRATLDPEP